MEPGHRRTKSWTQPVGVGPVVVGDGAKRIQTFIRVRPPCVTDALAHVPALALTPTTLRFKPSQSSPSEIECSFDRIFPPHSTQQDVFASVQALLASVQQGHNATMIAYGQTGTGKTHTMLGTLADPSVAMSCTGDDDGVASLECWGLMPRTLSQLVTFCSLHDQALSCAYVEIYNDKVFDLMADKKRQRPLALREGLEGATEIQGLTTHSIASIDDATSFLHRGRLVRAVRETDQNATSSRSHVILQIRIGQAKVNLVDLAGSEKWTKHTRAGAESDEIKHINTSLSALGNCIAALTQPGRRHIPYRDSTLTRLLQDSLGGATRTAVIATIHGFATDETIRTVQFADRMRAVMQYAAVARPPLDLPMSPMQLHKDLAATRVAVADLTQKLQALTTTYESQALASRQAIESMADAVYQKLLEDDEQIQSLHAKLATQVHRPPQITSALLPAKIAMLSSTDQATPRTSTKWTGDNFAEEVSATSSWWFEVPVMVFYTLSLGMVVTLFFAAVGDIVQGNPVDSAARLVTFQMWPVVAQLLVVPTVWTVFVLSCGKWMVGVVTVTTVVALAVMCTVTSTLWQPPTAMFTSIPLVSASLITACLIGRCLCARKQHAFNNAHVKVALQAVWTNPWTVVCLLAGLGATVVSFGLVSAVAATAAMEESKDASSVWTRWGVVGCVGFQFVWTVLVLRNAAIVSVASVLRQWWHHKHHASMGATLYNVLTNELRVLCFDALVLLLVIPLAVVWCAVGWAGRVCGVRKCVERFGTWLSCATIYGLVTLDVDVRASCFDRCRHAAHLFRSKGWSKIANSITMTVPATCHAIACGLVGAGGAWCLIHGHGAFPTLSGPWCALLSTSFAVGFSVGLLELAVGQAAVATVVVELARDPTFLSYRHGSDHNDLHAAWNITYPSELTVHRPSAGAVLV